MGEVQFHKPFQWCQEQEMLLKHWNKHYHLQCTPILAYANYDLLFVAHTDASQKWLVVLYQKQYGACEANTLPRRYKSQLVPQGSASVQYT